MMAGSLLDRADRGIQLPSQRLCVAKLTYPLQRFRYLSGYRGWVRASSVVDLVLAALMFIDLPETALWAPGLLLGANMILGGIALVVIALLERRKLGAEHADRQPAVRSDLR